MRGLVTRLTAAEGVRVVRVGDSPVNVSHAGWLVALDALVTGDEVRVDGEDVRRVTRERLNAGKVIAITPLDNGASVCVGCRYHDVSDEMARIAARAYADDVPVTVRRVDGVIEVVR